MPLSISLIRLPHLPTTTAHLPHAFLPPPSLKTLSLRRKPAVPLSLTHCQQIEQIAEQNDKIELIADQNGKIEPEFIPNNTRILIQNIPWTCVADDLRPLLATYGTVEDIELAMYNKSRNRGLAFVTMWSHEEACKVIEKLEATEFEGRVLKLDWTTKPKRVKGTPSPPKLKPVYNMYVANLAFQARSKDLKAFFSSTNAVSAEVIFDPSRRATGYGFVSFNTKEELEAAIVEFNEKEFMGRQIRVALSKRFLRKGTKETLDAQAAAKAAETEVETAA